MENSYTLNDLPEEYSEELREFITSMLIQDAKQRPSVESLLNNPVLLNHLPRISRYKE
jgi:hypothetical protein